jgi:hypothetical protein
MIVVGLMLALLVTIFGGYWLHWSWTGYEKPLYETVWDWLGIVLFPTTLLLLPLWLRSRQRRKVWWRVGFAVLALAFAVLVVGGYGLDWAWTGFSDNKLWDWLKLFLLPFALPVAYVWATTTPDLTAPSDERGQLDQLTPHHPEGARTMEGSPASPRIGNSASAGADARAVVDLVHLQHHTDLNIRLASRQLLESLRGEGRIISEELETGLKSNAPPTETQHIPDGPQARPKPEHLSTDGRSSTAAPESVETARIHLAPAPRMRAYRTMVIVIAAAATGMVVLGAWLALGVIRTPAQRVPGSTRVAGSAAPAHVVQVPGTQPWTGTNIYVQKGDRVTIDGRGQVHHDSSQPAVGPDGDPSSGLRKFNILPSADHAALIGEIIGNTPGGPFLVGSHYHTASIKQSGLLLLGVNDKGVNNNSGEFVASIEVAKP